MRVDGFINEFFFLLGRMLLRIPENCHNCSAFTYAFVFYDYVFVNKLIGSHFLRPELFFPLMVSFELNILIGLIPTIME